MRLCRADTGLWWALGTVGAIAAAGLVRRGSRAVETMYHGTSRPLKLLEQGVRLDVARARDPGDFGWGFYLTSDLNRAQHHGYVLEVDLDTSRLAFIKNPYWVRQRSLDALSDPERLFLDVAFGQVSGHHFMRSVTSWFPFSQRQKASKEIRDAFLAAGYMGIRSGIWDSETVVFDPSIVMDMRLHSSAEVVKQKFESTTGKPWSSYFAREYGDG